MSDDDDDERGRKRAPETYDCDADWLEDSGPYTWAKLVGCRPLDGIDDLIEEATPAMSHFLEDAYSRPGYTPSPAELDAAWDHVLTGARDRMLLGAAVVAHESDMTHDEFIAAARGAYYFVRLSGEDDASLIH